MAIVGPCSNSLVAPSIQVGARSAASGVVHDSTAALSSMCPMPALMLGDGLEESQHRGKHQNCDHVQFEQLYGVILSEAKDLEPASEILRFAQDDKGGHFYSW
jgi:hypothetical protein